MNRVRLWVTCRTCHGAAYVNRGRDPQWDTPCPACSGDGLVEAQP